MADKHTSTRPFVVQGSPRRLKLCRGCAKSQHSGTICTICTQLHADTLQCAEPTSRLRLSRTCPCLQAAPVLQGHLRLSCQQAGHGLWRDCCCWHQACDRRRRQHRLLPQQLCCWWACSAAGEAAGQGYPLKSPAAGWCLQSSNRAGQGSDSSDRVHMISQLQ